MTLRPRILRTLLYKELLSHRSNRGGLALALLLVVAAMLVAFFGRQPRQAGALISGVQHCFLDYWEDGPWIDHLRHHVPPALEGQIVFRRIGVHLGEGRQLLYPAGTGAIQIRTFGGEAGAPAYKVWFWQPGADGGGLAPFEAWFWKETRAFLQQQATTALEGLGAAATFPRIEEERSVLAGGLDSRSLIITALVFFAIFFVCVYLLSSLTCEERERGVLLAQALSPATLEEILAAKFLFYPLAALGLAGLLTGILSPPVLARPFFWLTVAVAAVGSLGIGLTIASLARTQRAASMGALCYMMAVTMLLFLCQQTGIPGLPNLALEYHCPRILQAVAANTVNWLHGLHLAAAAVLAAGWSLLATMLFCRQGWQ
jgi:hypothetical protein